jgi:orotate phosphoribosyltransferase
MILEHLKNNNSIKTGDFILSSGQKSDIYINIFNSISNGDNLEQLIDFLDELTFGYNFTYIHAVPYRAIPLAIQLAVINQCRYGFSRKEPKNHGDIKDKYIIGDLRPNDKVIIIEDVITTGNSVIKERTKLIEAEPTITIIETFCIVNRGNYSCKSLVTLDEIREYLKGE